MMDFEQLAQDMGRLQEKNVIATVCRAAEESPENTAKVLDALSAGMAIVGERFDSLEYFVGDLIFAGELFSEALEILRPTFPVAAEKSRKKVIIATVEGDLHDIGKNIVRSVMESKGLTVIDLGVNVSPAAIVQRTAEEGAHIVALSAVLTSALDAMKSTVDAFKAAGMREQVSIVIGGACVNESAARYINADYYGKTPEDTANFCMTA